MLMMAWRNLFRNIRRTIAVCLTVALGAGALLCFDGFNVGIMNQYRHNTIHSHYGYGQIHTKGYLKQVYEKPWEHWIENWSELKEYLVSLPEIENVFPRVSFFSLITNGRITVSGLGNGVDGEEESKFFNALNVEQGEMLSNQPDGILLGKGLAAALLVKPGDQVTLLGNTIRGSINGADFNVVGIFHTGLKEFDDRVFRIPLKQAENFLDTDRVESVALALKSLEDWPNVVSQVEKKFPNLEATSFAVLDKVYYQNSVDWLQAQFKVIQIIILTIVILGIFNSISTTILERKQEIGNLRANGESIWDVMKLLCLEGMALGALGAALGIVLAWILNRTWLHNGILMPPAPGLTKQFHVMIELQWSMALITLLMGIIAALAATAIAGVRTARMPIGELLRSV